MNLERISDALQRYTGQEESMQQVVAVLSEELGENWTQTVFQDLQGLSPALKENLNHAFSYYAATMAWNETQSYLDDKKLRRTPELEERLPILKHWLDFFGAPGLEAYQALEKKLDDMEPPEVPDPRQEENLREDPVGVNQEDIAEPDAGGNEELGDESPLEEDETPLEQDDQVDLGQLDESEPSFEEKQPEEIDQPEPEEASVSEEIAEEAEEPVLDTKEEEPGQETEATQEAEEESMPEAESGQEMEEEAVPEVETASEVEDKTEPEKETNFALDKIQKQLDLLDQNQAWLSARCVQLKNIEVYAYPFYGFIVDLLRQVLKDMNAVLEDEAEAALIETQFNGGQEAFNRRKEAIEHDIELAEQNCESAVTALISDDMDMDEIKRTLGTIDDSDSVEYVGPAPDGFELLDDETPLDENAIKKQYEKIEKMDALGTGQPVAEEKNEDMQENASQNPQKGVQRKLSFSLKRKKPEGDAT